MSVLIITGAIDITNRDIPITAVNDLNIRLEQYIHSIRYAILNYKKIKKIVFVDNTDYKYDYSVLDLLSIHNNKEFEIIKFKGNYDKIEEFGKGYGEIECIIAAINQSKLLQNETCFYKLTGRVVIKNFDKMIDSRTCSNAFIYKPSHLFYDRDHINTVFYSADIDFFVNHLSILKNKIKDRENLFIEDVFFSSIMDLKSNFNIGTFTNFPVISGISGSSGKNYDLSKIKIILYSYFAKTKLLDINNHSYPTLLLFIIKTIKCLNIK